MIDRGDDTEREDEEDEEDGDDEIDEESIKKLLDKCGLQSKEDLFEQLWRQIGFSKAPPDLATTLQNNPMKFIKLLQYRAEQEGGSRRILPLVNDGAERSTYLDLQHVLRCAQELAGSGTAFSGELDGLLAEATEIGQLTTRANATLQRRDRT